VTDALHIATYGEHGPRVVFLHGLFGQGRNWTQIAKAFADRHRVTLVDLPHHGRSPWRDDFDYLAMADEVAGLLDASDPVTLVGHSMGGKVAMLVALRHPELVARLCVVDVSPVAYPTASEFGGYVAAMKGLDLAAITTRDEADQALAEAVPQPTVRGFLLQNLRRDGAAWRWQMNLDVLGRELVEIGGWPGERLDGTPPYDGPVLWVNGQRSSYVQDDYVPAMDRLFPRNRRVTVKGAGHWVHSEQPEIFVEVLRRFIGSGQG
jgi:pimeloyl-ACP methyl ester carboxylesterase